MSAPKCIFIKIVQASLGYIVVVKPEVLIDNVVTVIETEECGWCTQCEAVCPTGAISCPFEIIIEER